MKVQAHEQAERAKPTPAPGQFQRVLHQAGAPQATPQRPPAPARPALPPSTSQPTPRVPVPPGRAAPPPPSTARAPSLATAGGPVLATARSALGSPENLGQARQAMHGEAQRLRATRTEAQTLTQERTEHRVCELISRELARELPPEPAPASQARVAPRPEEPSRGSTPMEGLTPVGEARLASGGPGLAPLEPASAQLKAQAALELIEKIETFVRSQRPALRMSLGAPLTAMVEVERTGPREVALRIQGRTGPLAHEDLGRIRDALGARGLRLRSLRAE